MILRVVVVDDEPLARQRIAAMLRRVADVEVVGEAADALEGAGLIARAKPDVVLLDINMPGESGFELLKRLKGPDFPAIVFVTAFDHFAARAFDVSALDYLLKPVSFDRLTQALKRVRSALRLRDADTRAAEIGRMLETLQRASSGGDQSAYDTEFWVLHRGEYRRVPVESLDWVEADRDYMRLHAGERQYLLRSTIGDLEARLDPEIFIRVRRSAIVRKKRIAAIRRGSYGALLVLLTNGTELRVGRSYAAGVRALLPGRSD